MLKSIGVIITLLMCVLVFDIHAQQAPSYALKNVIIHSENQDPYSGHVVWRNGTITAIGKDIPIPFDARITDGGDSLHVYPGFIDGSSTFGTPEPPRRQERPPRPGEPTYERAGIQPDRSPGDYLDPADKNLAALFNNGITVGAIGMKGNMLPGSVDVFVIDRNSTDKQRISTSVAQKYQFTGAQGVYPSTLMAIMAQTRQLWFETEALDAHIRLFNSNPSGYDTPRRDQVLETLIPVKRKEKPLFVHVDSKDDILRVFSLQNELGFDLVLVSAKEAYQLADEIKRRNISILASISINDKPDQKDTNEDSSEWSEEEASFRSVQLTAWQKERDNIKVLMDAGIRVGFALNDMDPSKFMEKIKLISESGMSEKQLLNVLTSNTAQILGINGKFGALRPGYHANLNVFSGPLTQSATTLMFVSNGNELQEISIPKAQTRGRR